MIICMHFVKEFVGYLTVLKNDRSSVLSFLVTGNFFVVGLFVLCVLCVHKCQY